MGGVEIALTNKSLVPSAVSSGPAESPEPKLLDTIADYLPSRTSADAVSSIDSWITNLVSTATTALPDASDLPKALADVFPVSRAPEATPPLSASVPVSAPAEPQPQAQPQAQLPAGSWLSNLVASAAAALPESPASLAAEIPSEFPALSDPQVLLSGQDVTEEEWLRRVELRWAKELGRISDQQTSVLSSLEALPGSSRMLFFVQPSPMERMEISLDRLHCRLRNSPSSRPDELRENFRFDGGTVVPRSPLHVILAELDAIAKKTPVEEKRRKKTKNSKSKPRTKEKHTAVRISHSTNFVLPPTQAVADAPPLSPKASAPAILVPAPASLAPTLLDSLAQKIDEDRHPSQEMTQAVTMEIPRPPEILGRALSGRKGLSCQVCRMGVRSREFPDMWSEQEGRKWRMCASCIAGMFPSLSVGRVPRGELLMIGRSNSEFLWELNPRACVAVETGEGEVWPTAYAAIAGEMFESNAEIRSEIYACFDAQEVDEVLKKHRARIRTDWRFIRLSVIRRILKQRNTCHPLMERLLCAIADKRLSFELSTDLVLGDGQSVANICMELVDEAAAKNRS